MRSLASEAKAAREALVLDAAAVEFNRVGVAAASLTAIARGVGLSRAGLYNYCADREDLACKAYLRACALTGEDLERARLGGGPGAAQLQAFLRFALAMDHPPMAALTDLSALSPAQQAEVRGARARNVEQLGAILEAGMADGSLRSHNVELACQTIWGVLAWAPLARTWTGEDDDPFAIRMAAALPELLLRGIAAGGYPAEPTPFNLLAERVPAFVEIDARYGELLAKGSQLFNQRGVDGVSLEDVAAAVGATKGLVYHRHKSKPAFVAACYDRAFDLYDAIMAVSDTGVRGIDGGRLGMELNIQAQLSPTPPMSLSAGFELLTRAERDRFTARTRALRAKATEHGRRGVRDGTLRPYDLEPVSLASAGVFSYLAKWPLRSNLPAAEIARQAADIFFYGLRA